jgi:hypothetical protein
MFFINLLSCASDEPVSVAEPQMEQPVVEEQEEQKEPEKPQNRAPVIESAEFVNPSPTAQEEVRVVVKANDPDNERVRFDYEWVVNGKKLPSEHRNVLSDGRVKKGDDIILTILASDGKAETKKQMLLTIANASPFWLEDPRLSSDLNGFKVKAADPDDDPITYRLTGAPDGMTIDAEEGVLSYEGSTKEPGGSYTIDVFAEDPEKLFVKWSFSIEVSPGSEAGQ